MPHNSDRPQKHRHDNYRWVVDFSLRIANDDQRRVVDALGIARVHDVVKTWLAVLAPGACVVDLPNEPIRRIAFSTRASARRFKVTWGGRIVTPTSDLNPSLGTI
jgi:hypothetical protein